MNKRVFSTLVVLLAVVTDVRADEPQQAEFFETKIRPVLVQHCYKCHSAGADKAGKLKGGLLLDDRDSLRRSGESGPAIVPGNAKKSLLLAAINYDNLEMPPKGKLPKSVIADFAKWLQMGAPDPRDGKGVIRKTIDLEKGREFWAFQPVAKVQVPDSKDRDLTDIDKFVAHRFKSRQLKWVEPASAGTLVRRLYFDLVGLPPSVEELSKWTDAIAVGDAGKRKDALAELVDQLLASPQFGERWGRHWLDVARFAESNGNSRNATFPHAWRFRDYVIDAFNADTPYDDFIKQQIAGDLLAHESVDERNRNLVATGFLALASKPVIRGKRGGFIPDIAADQIEVTSRSILALTVACARCHDHKFDPIPTTDYYGLAGIFASSNVLYGGGSGNMGGAPATGLHVLADKDPSKAKAYDAWKKEVARLTAKQKELNNKIKKLRPKRRKKGQPAPKTENEKELAELDKQRRQLATTLKKLRGKPPQAPQSAMGVSESNRVLEVAVYLRGESPKGRPVSRRFVSVAFGDDLPELPTDQSGRLELANWLASESNPLTARVMVNRVWQHLFGRGIVATPDNFGINGDRPTHPELLDHLATKFVADGWSVKRLIQRLVLTRTYQLADSHDANNFEADPDNVYLWRHTRKRLEAEAIRDSILATSGKLELERPKGSVVTIHNGKLIQDALTPDKIHRPSNHRSVYLPILRNGLPESLEVFDMADPSLVVGRRSVTTVPSQDLFLMNSKFVVENAEAFAQRLLAEPIDDTQRISLAYVLAVSRKPTSAEQSRAVKLIEEIESSLSNDDKDKPKLAAWAAYCQALYVSAEFRHVR
jgi:hypothetical protein